MTESANSETTADAPVPPQPGIERGSPGDDAPITYEVPDGTAAAECGYCGRPFADEDYLALHRGLAHPDRIDPDERRDFERVYEAESDDLRLFRLKAMLVLVLVYFGMLMVYAVVT